jgi:hypothetical protein
MTRDTSTLLAAGENMSSLGASNGVTSFMLTVILGLALPLMSIALVIMLPLRSARSSGDNGSAVGLGDRSLQEEFWEFIDDVERGRVTLSDVPATPELGAASVSGHDAGGQRTDEA